MSHSDFLHKDARCAQRVPDSFAKQGAMQTMGAGLERIEPGAMDVAHDWAPTLILQHGFIHAGMLSIALDSVCGCAGFCVRAEDAAALPTEFKIHLLPAAGGERMRLDGRVLKPGQTVALREGRALGVTGGNKKLVASMGCTLICKGAAPLRGRKRSIQFH